MRIIYKFLFAVVLIVIVAFIYNKWQDVKQIIEPKELVELSKMPPFSFYTLSNEFYAKNDLPADKSIVVIYFNSECEYCEDKAEQIAYYSKEFRQSMVLFISSENVSAISKFAKKFNLLEYPNFVVLQSRDNGFYRSFGTDFVPAVLVFNKKGKLMVKIDDVVPIKTIVKYVRASNLSIGE